MCVTPDFYAPSPDLCDLALSFCTPELSMYEQFMFYWYHAAILLLRIPTDITHTMQNPYIIRILLLWT